MYTLFHRAHTTGSTVMRALAWEFPNDPQLAAVDTQFLLGPALLVTPVLQPQVNYTKGVFPGIVDGECWYDWYSQKKFEVEPGVNASIEAPLGKIPLFVRGGYVLPMQKPGYTTKESRKNPWNLLVALSEDGDASGELYVDDGDSLEPAETLEVKFEACDGKLEVSVEGNYMDTNALGNVTIMGVDDVGKMRLDGMVVGKAHWDYREEDRLLKFTNLGNMTTGGAWSKSWTLSWE